MTPELPIVVGIAVMVLSLFLIPLGAPGLWIMIAVLGFGAWKDEVAWWVWGFLVVVAGLAELAEFLIVERTSARYGGSRRAFWGAIAGGLLGVVIGLPVPVPLLGPLLAGLLGTFLGAALVTYWETRHLHAARRVAWGALVGRAFAAAAKTAAGVIILVVGSTSLLVR
ncbi:MAG TPA: DUF456 domain-containing protein [Gemmatimonadota bacterium]|nr:DUF456 domain-containing protein [Gemmatimonadota bacterium]